MLAKIELELKQEGCKNVNTEAQKKFQHRSLAAIRSHRRQSSYRMIFRNQSGDMGCREIMESRTENADENHPSVPPSDALVRDGHWSDIAKAEPSLNSLEKKRILQYKDTFLICQQTR